MMNIAICHIWGDPKTVQRILVAGAGEVDLSPGKRDILSILRRPDICRDSWFWMDLFCIDQSEGASISIQDQLTAIPAIYKSSICMKVLIEGPVCENWYDIALRSQAYAQWSSSARKNADLKEVEEFLARELQHSRKCPSMIFLDAWFDRLWTRQEGLYAAKLDIVVLNPIACLRNSSSKVQTPQQKWTIEGDVTLRRERAFTFIEDKIKYHGLPRDDSYRYSIFFDMVYTRHLDIQKYHGSVGPAPGYSPINETWRSNRKPTKARDYVLAVLPDIDGYKLPANPRTMTFPELLIDAVDRIERLDVKQRIAIKVSASIVNHNVGADFRPFLLDKPEDVG